jgi:hypothetical protein
MLRMLFIGDDEPSGFGWNHCKEDESKDRVVEMDLNLREDGLLQPNRN